MVSSNLFHESISRRYNLISSNPNLTMSMIIQYLDKEWDWDLLSWNPGITVQDSINHPEYPWRWNNVFRNKFTLDNSLYGNNQIGRKLSMSIL